VEKYGTARQDIVDNILRYRRLARWVTIATGTHSEYVIGYLLLFHGNNSYAKVPYSYVYMYRACLVNRT